VGNVTEYREKSRPERRVRAVGSTGAWRTVATNNSGDEPGGEGTRKNQPGSTWGKLRTKGRPKAAKVEEPAGKNQGERRKYKRHRQKREVMGEDVTNGWQRPGGKRRGV